MFSSRVKYSISAADSQWQRTPAHKQPVAGVAAFASVVVAPDMLGSSVGMSGHTVALMAVHSDYTASDLAVAAVAEVAGGAVAVVVAGDAVAAAVAGDAVAAWSADAVVVEDLVEGGVVC